jgi:hypothetical protein
MMLVADNVTRHRSAVSNRVGSSECFPRSLITCTFFNCLESSIVSIYMQVGDNQENFGASDRFILDMASHKELR